MPLAPLYGHDRLQHRLVGALASGRLPQALVLVGPAGVGKQRLALWLAQALVCQGLGAAGPCGRCDACRRAVNLGHPDVHWFVPIPRVEASGPDRAVEKAQEALAEVWAERRVEGRWRQPDGLAAHHLASVRLLLRRLFLKPAMSGRKVFVVGDAERLVPQEASPEAANALLKALEEPPSDTMLLLTATELGALLPTIRSRLVPVRVNRVPDEVVAQFLEREVTPALSPAELRRRVAGAEGCIGRSLADEQSETASQAATRLIQAAAGSSGDRAVTALAQAPWSARGEFTATLDAVAWSLREQIRTTDRGGSPRRLVEALDAVARAREQAQGNVNPQLLLSVLLEELGGAAR